MNGWLCTIVQGFRNQLARAGTAIVVWMLIYSALMLIVVFANYNTNLLEIYPEGISDSERVVLTLKILKIISLSFIFLEAFGAIQQGGDDGQKLLWHFAKISAGICFFVVILLVVTMYGKLYSSVCNYYSCESKELIKIYVDSILSISPLVVFMVVNILFMAHSNTNSDVYYISKIYFFMVNMPSVISLVMVQILSLVVIHDVDLSYISVLNSGAISLLIFMTLCLSLYAKELAKKRRGGQTNPV